MIANRVLVLDFDDDTQIATCFDRTEKRLLKIRVDLDRDPLPGQFIKYIKEAEHGSSDGIINATLKNALIENATTEDYVKVENGRLLISSWIGFSDNPNHRTFDRSVAFGDWYGFIDNSNFREEVIRLGNQSKARLFTSNIVVKDLNYLENNTQLFEVSDLRYPITGAAKKKQVEKCLNNLDAYEKVIAERQTGQDRSSSSDASRKVPLPQTDQVLAVIQNRGTSRPSSVVPTSVIPHQVAQRRSQSVAPPQPSSPHSPQTFALCQKAIAMTRSSGNEFAVWMSDQKAVAILDRNRPGAQSVRLGSMFECVYGKEGHTFMVYEVRRMVERELPFAVSEVDDKCFEAQFVVDLCTPNFDFNFWSIYTGIAVLNAEQVGRVTTADKIEVPGTTKHFYKVMRTYMGEPVSERMVSWCRLEEQRLPRMVVESEYQGFEIVRRYHWKLYKVVASVSNAERRNMEQRKSNLGVRSPDYETMDDVARYKREFQQNQA